MNIMSMSNECERFNCSYDKILTPNARRNQEEQKRKKKKCKNEYEMFDCCYVKTKKKLLPQKQSHLSISLWWTQDSQTVTNNRLVKMERR